MKKKLALLITSSWFWAAIPAVVISFFINDVGKQYSVLVEKKFNGNPQSVYADLNGDGISELIRGKPGPPLNNFPILDQDDKNFEQWNLPDNLTTGISEIITGDYDHDSFREIYVFTTKDDSIFLNVNEILDAKGIRLQRLFITTVKLVQDHIDSNLKPIGFYDQNQDGKDEIYFGITSGFGLVPRLCYFYDLQHHSLKSSPFTGINFNKPQLRDIDNDGRPEIFSNMTASGNYHTPTPYTDYSAWLMVLDDQLEMKFPAVEFPGFGGLLDIFSIGKGMDRKLAVIYNYTGTSDSILNKPGVNLYTSKGKFLRQKTFDELGIDNVFEPTLLKIKDTEFIVLVNKSIVLLNEELAIVKRKELSDPSFIHTHTLDLDGDGQEELFVFSQDKQMLEILNSDLEEYDIFPFEAASQGWQISSIVAKSGEKKLFIKSGDTDYYLQLKKNPYYLLEYLTYPAIYLGFVLFIGFVKKVTTQQVEKREQRKRKIQTLQLQSIKGQLDPHFTFNALNSVAALLYLDDRNAAYDYLNKFTRLLRQLLADAERVYRTLDEELEFVTAYLNLEKLRFGDKFNFEITLGDTITRQEIVPVMVLQTFAENAIKHGLMPRTEGGKLTITIEKENEYLRLSIEDNGVGRAKAAENTKRQGKGLKMIHEFYEILNQINKKPIRYTITDLYKGDDVPAGTRAEVWVPLDLKDNNHKSSS
jgi:two-component sensor histidine kinase